MVTPDTSIETASKMAMARCQPYIYDSIPVVDGMTQAYIGFVTIKDLLLSAVNIQVKRAAAITNRTRTYESIGALSLVIAKTKKQAKQQSGNSLVIT